MRRVLFLGVVDQLVVRALWGHAGHCGMQLVVAPRVNWAGGRAFSAGPRA
jgi:hypothetical protein